MTPVLFGMNGRMGSGKDTVFNLIDRWARLSGLFAVRQAFADPLKWSGINALGEGRDLSPDEKVALANKIKDNGTVTVEYFEEGPSGLPIPKQIRISGRKFWQYYGTEAHRDPTLGHSFGLDFWVENILPDNWDVGLSDVDVSVITDCRFVNEAERVRQLGGYVIEIDADGRLGPRDDHPSEAPLPRELVDFTIDNNGHPDALIPQVDDIMKRFFD